MNAHSAEFKPNFTWGDEEWQIKPGNYSGIRVRTESFTATLAELKVLCLVHRGYIRKEIAQKLASSPQTVKNQLQSVFRANSDTDERHRGTSLSHALSANKRQLLFPITLIGLRYIEAKTRGETLSKKDIEEFSPIYPPPNPNASIHGLLRLVAPFFMRRPLIQILSGDGVQK